MERWDYEVGREWWDYQDKDVQWQKDEERKLDEQVERASKTLSREFDSLEGGGDQRKEE